MHQANDNPEPQDDDPRTGTGGRLLAALFIVVGLLSILFAIFMAQIGSGMNEPSVTGQAIAVAGFGIVAIVIGLFVGRWSST